MKQINFALLLCILFFVSSCKKDNIVATAKNVYIAGCQSDGGPCVARYWKNGEAVSITGSTGAVINSIFVDGNDVYAAGNEGDVSKYWKNGVATNLTDGLLISYAYSIYVSNGDVYVAGIERDKNTLEYVHKYWKNGQAVAVPGARINLWFNNSILVVGNDVYVTGGGINANGVIAYLKNGVPVNFPPGTHNITVGSIAVAGNDVYITGRQWNPVTNKFAAKYWKNNQLINLVSDTTVNSSANGIVIANNTVHIIGDINEVPTYWKNGVPHKLADRGVAYSIAVYGNDVFIAGNIDDYNVATPPVGTYWKNGVPNPVSTVGSQVFVRSIFVTE